jgi:NAD(P)-dependent dehydrogenase (short-subunit alcohol dehydrogenase family)
MGAYNISKAGLIHMTKQLAMELAPDIRVNGVAPAVVKTKLSQMLWEDNEKASADLHALKKLGTPEDISNLMFFLSSEEASWITGEIITIDGGYLL